MDTTTTAKIINANAETVKVMNGNSIVWSGEPPYKMGKYLEQSISDTDYTSYIPSLGNMLVFNLKIIKLVKLKNGDIITVSCDWEKLFTYQGVTSSGEKWCGNMYFYLTNKDYKSASIDFNNRWNFTKGMEISNRSNSFIAKKINDNTGEIKVINASDIDISAESPSIQFFNIKKQPTIAEALNLVKGCKISILVNGE